MEKLLRELVQATPQDIAMRLHLADMMELQGNYAEVETLCREVLRQQDTNLVALNNLAWLLGQQADKAAEALKLINRAIEKHGPRPELLDTRAVVHLTMGNAAAAIRDLERVVNEAPSPGYLYHLSRAYKRAQNSASALAMLRRANDMGLTLQHLHPVEHAEYQRVIADLGKQPG
jgi:tetratricopeptide (TPR) repeat protein